MLRTHGWQPRLIQLLTIPGVMVAFYLHLYHEGIVTSACKVGGWSNCDAVSGPHAVYSTLPVVGISVAIMGLAGYIAIFLVVWASDFVPLVQRYLRELLVGMIGFGFLFTAYLTALEAFVLNAWCQYCLISAGIITVMLLIAISYLFAPRSVSALERTAHT